MLGAVRPGFELGYQMNDKFYVNNHLMFKILVHETNGQYTRARQNGADLEAAAAVEVRAGAGLQQTLWCCIRAGGRGTGGSCEAVL